MIILPWQLRVAANCNAQGFLMMYIFPNFANTLSNFYMYIIVCGDGGDMDVLIQTFKWFLLE